MTTSNIVGAVLIALGVAGFFTGGFSFTKDTVAAKVGPLELTVQEKETVTLPKWMSLGAVALGLVVLVAGARRR